MISKFKSGNLAIQNNSFNEYLIPIGPRKIIDKLLINTATTFKGGGVQVARSFIEECRNFDQYEYHIVMSDMLSMLLNPDDYPDNFSFYKIGFRPATRVFSFKSRDHFFEQIESKINPDVVFTTTGPAYWKPKAPHLVGFNLPHYVYSDSPFFSRISSYQRIKWFLKGEVIKYFFKKEADAYVVQTNDVKQRLQDLLYVEHVYTVSNTFSDHYRQPLSVGNKLPYKEEDEFRFLTLSAWYPHKNIDIIPEVISYLPTHIKERVRFILTLPKDIFKKHFSNEYSESIINIGPVKPEEGPSLYRECDSLFLPTLLECFSASYAEAMVMHKPVVTTDLGFARSICGDAALYYQPVDPRDAAEKIRVLVSNKKLQENLIQEGRHQLQKFDTPHGRAKKYLKLCEKVAAKEEIQGV